MTLAFLMNLGFAGGSGLIYASLGEQQLFTSANWSGVSWVFQATLYNATTGTAYARAWDRTAAATVAGSDISTTATVKTRVQSGAITLVDGHEYEPQYARSVGGDGGTWGGRLIGLPA